MSTSELLERWREGSISEAELRELTARLAQCEHRDDLLDDWLIVSALPQVLGGAAVARLQKPKVVPLPGTTRSPSFWRSSLTAAAAVLTLAAVFAVLFLPQPSAAAIVRRALKVHAAELDRCYRMEATLEPAAREKSGWWPETFGNKVWTRGDRFWIETLVGERTVAWGRDAAGSVWIALSPSVGVRLEADEVGERLTLHCELRTLQIESLLQIVLVDFDLRREPGGPGIEIIHAQLKTGREHRLYRAAILEVDTATGELRRVVLDRLHQGLPMAKVTYTLVEAGQQPAAAYTLSGHLTPQAKIYDRHHEPARRAWLLARDFLKGFWPGDSAH